MFFESSVCTRTRLSCFTFSSVLITTVLLTTIGVSPYFAMAAEASCCKPDCKAPVVFACSLPGCWQKFCAQCAVENVRRCDGVKCHGGSEHYPCKGEHCGGTRCATLLGCRLHMGDFDTRCAIPTQQVQVQPPSAFLSSAFPLTTIVAPQGSSACVFCTALLCPHCASGHQPGVCAVCRAPACAGLPSLGKRLARCGVKCRFCAQLMHIECYMSQHVAACQAAAGEATE